MAVAQFRGHWTTTPSQGGDAHAKGHVWTRSQAWQHFSRHHVRAGALHRRHGSVTSGQVCHNRDTAYQPAWPARGRSVQVCLSCRQRPHACCSQQRLMRHAVQRSPPNNLHPFLPQIRVADQHAPRDQLGLSLPGASQHQQRYANRHCMPLNMINWEQARRSARGCTAALHTGAHFLKRSTPSQPTLKGPIRRPRPNALAASASPTALRPLACLQSWQLYNAGIR